MADPAVGYDGNPLSPSNGGTATDNSAFLKQLAAALAAVGGGIGGRAIANSQGNPLTSAVQPELSSMLQQANQRQAFQNPLFQATTQGAYAMLPDFAKTGTSMSGSLPNTVPSPSGGAGGGGATGGPGVGSALGIGGAAALLSALGKNGGSFDLSKIFDAIKKKFGAQNPGVQGNQPNAGGGLPSGNPGQNGFTGWDSGGAPLPSDPGVYYGSDGGGAQPTDPSGGTGVGPGMQDFYDWLASQGNSGGSAPTETFGTEPSPEWGG